jgi:hypothetical protein
MINLEAQKSPLFISVTGGTPFFFRNLDVEFEDGLWREWPPVPGVIVRIVGALFFIFESF